MKIVFNKKEKPINQEGLAAGSSRVGLSGDNIPVPPPIYPPIAPPNTQPRLDPFIEQLLTQLNNYDVFKMEMTESEVESLKLGLLLGIYAELVSLRLRQ